MKRGSLIGAFFGFIARRAIPMMLIVGICVALAVIYLRLTTYKYEVSMEVASLSIHEGDSQGSTFPNVRLLGIGGQSTGLSPFKLYIRNLESYKTAEALYTDEAFLQEMFPDRWDSENNRWIKAEGALVNLRHSFADLVDYPFSLEAKPTVDTLWKSIRQKISVEEVDDSIRKLTVYVTKPEFGIELLSKLHKVADSNARDFVEESSSRTLESLEARYERTTVKDVREQLLKQLLVHERMLVMTKGGGNFAAEEFQRPVAESAPSRPNPLIILALAVAAGMVLFLLLVLMQEKRRIDRERGPMYLDEPYKGRSGDS